MMAHDEHNPVDIIVDEINHLNDQEQADFIADKFSSVSNEYSPLYKTDIDIENEDTTENNSYFTPEYVLNYLNEIKVNKSNIKGDIPAKIIKEISNEICTPYTHVLNTMVCRGEYPFIWKMEIQTPVPKVYPPTKVSELRNISGLWNLDKVAQTIFGDLITDDMKPNMDISQYGNQKNTSI